MNSTRKFSIGAGVLMGLIAMSFMMFAAWQLNPQGEIYDGEDIHWGYWIGIGVSWFIPTTVVTMLLVFAAARLGRAFLKKVLSSEG